GLGLAGLAAVTVAVLAGGASANVPSITSLHVTTAVRPLPDTSVLAHPFASVPHLKTWSSSVTVSGTKYPFTMVGKNVKNVQATPTTTVTVPVIPLIIKIGTNTFDPTTVKSGCETQTAQTRFKNSPIFDSSTTFVMNGVNEGATQYVDAFQR